VAKDMTTIVNPLKIKGRRPLIGAGSWRRRVLTKEHYAPYEDGRHTVVRACLGDPLLTRGCGHTGSRLKE
jgi:hypothetical protein